jgi:hypothetical protein
MSSEIFIPSIRSTGNVPFPFGNGDSGAPKPILQDFFYPKAKIDTGGTYRKTPYSAPGIGKNPTPSTRTRPKDQPKDKGKVFVDLGAIYVTTPKRDAREVYPKLDTGGGPPPPPTEVKIPWKVPDVGPKPWPRGEDRTTVPRQLPWPKNIIREREHTIPQCSDDPILQSAYNIPPCSNSNAQIQITSKATRKLQTNKKNSQSGIRRYNRSQIRYRKLGCISCRKHHNKHRVTKHNFKSRLHSRRKFLHGLPVWT